MERNRLLRGLSSEELRWLESFWKEEYFAAGTRLLTAGEVNQRLYLIDEGVVRMSRRPTFSGVTLKEDLQTGRFFGESSVLDGLPSQEDALAVTDVRVRSFKQTSFLEILSTDHHLAQQILRNLVADLVKRFRELDDRYGDWAAGLTLPRYNN